MLIQPKAGEDGKRRGRGFEFTPECQEVLQAAQAIARRLRSPHQTEHLLLAMLGRPESEPVRLVTELGGSVSDIQTDLEWDLVTERDAAGAAYTSKERESLEAKRTRASLEEAMVAAVTDGVYRRDVDRFLVDSTHLLRGVLADRGSTGARVMRQRGVSYEDLHKAMREADRPRGEFAVVVDEDSDRPIYEQIADQYKEAIAAGFIAPNRNLPSVRRLAEDLRIAPNTVVRAYGVLVDEGIITTDGTRGTYVAAASAASARERDRTKEVHEALRNIAVAAYHADLSADDLRSALEASMKDIFRPPADDSPLRERGSSRKQ